MIKYINFFYYIYVYMNNVYNDMTTPITGLFTERFKPIIPETSNDPIKNYLVDNGLSYRENNLYYISNYINIDSSFRNKQQIIKYKSNERIEKNSIEFFLNSSIIKINCKNNYNIDDKIIISNINPIKKLLKIKLKDDILLQFKEGSKYAKIILPLIDSTYDYFSQVRLYSFQDSKFDFYIKISNFIAHNNYIGNIHINFINDKHKIYLNCPDDTWLMDDNYYNGDTFYIDIKKVFYGTANYINCTIEILFYYIYGIPIKCFDNIYSICNINNKSIYIDLNIVPIIPFNLKSIQSDINNIIIKNIDSYEPAYLNSNEYIYNLNEALNNVICIKLINTVFPNIHKNIIKDNNFYWQEKTEKEINFIKFPEGKYEIEEFCDIINNDGRLKASHNKYNNSISFICEKKIILNKPFINYDNETSIIRIKHDNHNFSKNDKIIIKNSKIWMGISDELLNKEHEIINIIDNSHYEIQINNTFILEDVKDNGGGENVKILYNEYFKIIFDQKNMINIFKYDNSILEYDIEHNIKIKKDDTYFLMLCDIGMTTQNKGPIKNYFAKIIIEDKKEILYDTFVNTPLYLTNPIPSLYNIKFTFVNKDGTLYDFDNQDHNFVLEIITQNQLPKGTNINPNLFVIN